MKVLALIRVKTLSIQTILTQFKIKISNLNIMQWIINNQRQFNIHNMKDTISIRLMSNKKTIKISTNMKINSIVNKTSIKFWVKCNKVTQISINNKLINSSNNRLRITKMIWYLIKSMMIYLMRVKVIEPNGIHLTQDIIKTTRTWHWILNKNTNKKKESNNNNGSNLNL
jgi:hypothetical protein